MYAWVCEKVMGAGYSHSHIPGRCLECERQARLVAEEEAREKAAEEKAAQEQRDLEAKLVLEEAKRKADKLKELEAKTRSQTGMSVLSCLYTTQQW